MEEHVDAVVIGMGPGGEVAASELAKAGKRVAVVERELIGGECAYYACIPSKVVLRSPEVAQEVRNTAGVSDAHLTWEDTRTYRDDMIRHLDDAKQVTSYQDQGVLVYKGEARIVRPGVVAVGDTQLHTDSIIIATGSGAFVPPIDGVDTITAWTNRELYTVKDLPGAAIIVGGSAVALESATFLARFGVQVTVLNRGLRLLGREDPRVGDLAQQHVADAGVTVRLGVEPVSAQRDEATGASVLHLNDGTTVSADVVIFATGRTPRTGELGVENAGVQLGEHGEIIVDEHCQAATGVWAVGDVTGIMPYTHVAKYQGRIAADAILGGQRTATYEGVPRVVFADPEIAAVGVTAQAAREQGVRVVENELDLTAALAKPWLYEQEPHGTLGVIADADRRTLIGAWAVGPLASEWIHWAAFAIRTHTPIDVLLDQIPQFPTYHEAYLSAIGGLDLG